MWSAMKPIIKAIINSLIGAQDPKYWYVSSICYFEYPQARCAVSELSVAWANRVWTKRGRGSIFNKSKACSFWTTLKPVKSNGSRCATCCNRGRLLHIWSRPRPRAPLFMGPHSRRARNLSGMRVWRAPKVRRCNRNNLFPSVCFYWL
jgi:hypothetical protein